MNEIDVMSYDDCNTLTSTLARNGYWCKAESIDNYSTITPNGLGWRIFYGKFNDKKVEENGN